MSKVSVPAIDSGLNMEMALQLPFVQSDFMPAILRSCSKMTSWQQVAGANLPQIGMKPL